MSTPRKRQASRSPEYGRSAKRPLNSSPEEGEVDDSAPVPPILSIPLPPKPATKGVPFPFKKKTDPPKNGADEAAASATPPNVFTKFEEDANKKVAKDESKKPRLSRPPPGKMDHYEPPQRSLLSRLEPREELQGRYSGHGSRRRSRSPLGFTTECPLSVVGQASFAITALSYSQLQPAEHRQAPRPRP